MKTRVGIEGLGIPATVAAILPKDTLVAITGNRTVNKAGLNADSIGYLRVPAATVNGKGTVETKFKELIEIKFSGAIAAGADVKLAAPDGTTGENVAIVWVSGTDAIERRLGKVWNGVGDGAVGEVLVY